MSDITPPPPPASPAPSAGGLPPAIANLSNDTLEWAKVGGGAVAAISTFLPWFSIHLEFFGQSIGGGSYNGFNWNGFWGFVLLLLGLAVAFLAFVKVRNVQIQGLDKLPPALPFLLAAALGVIALWAFIDVMSNTSALVSSGIGIWLTFLGALVAVAAAALPVVKNKGLPKA